MLQAHEPNFVHIVWQLQGCAFNKAKSSLPWFKQSSSNQVTDKLLGKEGVASGALFDLGGEGALQSENLPYHGAPVFRGKWVDVDGQGPGVVGQVFYEPLYDTLPGELILTHAENQ